MLNIKKTLTKLLTQEAGTLQILKGTAGAGTRCTRNGNVVEFFIDLSGLTYISGWNTVAQLPSGWEPNNYYDDASASAKVTSTGEIQIFNSSYVGAKMRIHSTHLVKWGGVIRTLKSAISNLYREGVAVC